MMLVTTLDDIAWVLNLRGNDIEFNPLFFSYLLIHFTSEEIFKIDLFISPEKVSDIKDYLEENNITVENYDSIFSKLSEYGKSLPEDKRTILVDKDTCN